MDNITQTVAKRVLLKSHPTVLLLAALEVALAYSDEMPSRFGKARNPRTIMQEVLHRCISALNSTLPKKQMAPLHELQLAMQGEASTAEELFEPIEGRLNVDPVNSGLLRLRAHLIETEVRGVVAHERLMVEDDAANVTPGLVETMPQVLSSLHVAAEYAFAYAWIYSVEAKTTKLRRGFRWTPLTDEQLARLNPDEVEE